MDNNINIIEKTLEICNKGYYYINNKKIKLSLNKEQMQKAVVYSESMKTDDYFAQTLNVLGENIQELRMSK